MMQRKYISFLLAAFFLFAALSSYGNLPDGTPKNGKDKPWLTTGNDGGDGAGEQNRCSICGCLLGSSGGVHGDCGGGSPGCISMEFPFGRPVHSGVIPAGTIRLLSDAPSPKLFSPQGLYYDFNLESYATHKGNRTTVIRPNGFEVVYEGTLPSGSQTSFRSHLEFSAENTSAAPGDGQACPHPVRFDRIFGNGSRACYEIYAGQNAETACYRLQKLCTADGMEITASHRDIGIEVIRDADRCLRQIWSLADGLADIVATGEFAYEIRMYAHACIGGRTLSYTYSSTGVRGRCTGLAGNHAYSYDQYGRISQVNGISFTRLANSELVSLVSFPNGVTSLYGYESDRDIESGVAHGSFASCGYENNAIGNRVGMSRTGSVFAASDTITYSYNGRSELTGAVSDAANTDYSYAFSFDPIGNRLNASLAGQSVSYTANQLNQYTAVNNDAPTYDLDGNMLTNSDWSYAWNGENRLVRAENAVTGAALEFDYDYMGRRIFKKVYHGTVLEKHLLFVYDGYKLIEERDALDGGSLVRQYAWQPEVLGRDVPLTVHDAASNATYYYHTDANKNVTELTDESGAVVAHYEYSPFGTVTRMTGTLAAANPFRFSSEYSDAETGLVYYNYRYYSPELGRWISRDPIGELGGCNLYGMLGNNPLLGWDVLGHGHAWWCPQGAYSWVMTGDRNASSDMLSAANEGFMEGLSDGAAGVGDGLTTIPGTNISLTREARKALDINYIYDPEVYVLANYAGEFAQYVIIIALTAQEKPQLSSNNVAESVTKNGKTVGNLSDAVPNGKSIPAKPITNRPQHGSAAHNQKMLDEAQRMLDSKYIDVRTNQQLVNTRGNKVSNVRPDVQGTNPITGKRDVIEIQSPSQNNDFMNKKIEILRNILGDDAGIVTWK